MSVEPVTITIVTEDPYGDAQHQLARVKAAEELGLDPTEIEYLTIGKPVITREAVWSPALEALYSEPDPDTGSVRTLRDPVPSALVTPAEYSCQSTWAPKHIAPTEPTPAPIPWPTVKLSRGAKWHGLIPNPDGGEPYEAMLISDGERLLLIDSADGQLLMAEMGGEKPVTTVVPANTFG